MGTRNPDPRDGALRPDPPHCFIMLFFFFSLLKNLTFLLHTWKTEAKARGLPRSSFSPRPRWVLPVIPERRGAALPHGLAVFPSRIPIFPSRIDGSFYRWEFGKGDFFCVCASFFIWVKFWFRFKGKAVWKGRHRNQSWSALVPRCTWMAPGFVSSVRKTPVLSVLVSAEDLGSGWGTYAHLLIDLQANGL